MSVPMARTDHQEVYTADVLIELALTHFGLANTSPGEGVHAFHLECLCGTRCGLRYHPRLSPTYIRA